MALAERLPDPEAVALLRRETGLAHVLVHVPPYPGPKTREWYQLANRGGRPDFRLVARDGRDFLFAVGEP